ncbi:MAG TPA: TetR/AcrR family transcriptional regulator [Acidimicrobiales bacterium]|nr:TetR/AcrR family transcriptional regulator [Acidimicrobiales bacterium]
MATESAAAAETSLLDEQRDLARSRILKAAQRALAARGLVTTVDDVAEAAGVSRRTVFRHFASRERLFAAAIREGLRTYAEHVPGAPDGDVGSWLVDVLVAAHRINARNGRIYWDLSALEPDLTGELAAAGAERREARRRFVVRVGRTLWQARGGTGDPPGWLSDAVAIHLSGFTTQSLAGDFGRSPDEVARVSARVLEAAVRAALADQQAAPGPTG